MCSQIKSWGVDCMRVDTSPTAMLQPPFQNEALGREWIARRSWKVDLRGTGSPIPGVPAARCGGRRSLCAAVPFSPAAGTAPSGAQRQAPQPRLRGTNSAGTQRARRGGLKRSMRRAVGDRVHSRQAVSKTTTCVHL